VLDDVLPIQKSFPHFRLLNDNENTSWHHDSIPEIWPEGKCSFAVTWFPLPRKQILTFLYSSYVGRRGQQGYPKAKQDDQSKAATLG